MSEERNDVRLKVRLDSAMAAIVILKNHISHLIKEVESVGTEGVIEKLKPIARFTEFAILADDALRKAGLNNPES